MGFSKGRSKPFVISLIPLVKVSPSVTEVRDAGARSKARLATLDAVPAKKGFDRGGLPTEALVEHFSILSVTLGKDTVTEALGRLAREDPFLLEGSERICIEYLRPFVALVAGAVATGEDVSEGSTHLTGGW